MESIQFDNFAEGIDRRKGRTGKHENALWLLKNCYVDRGGVIRKRPGLKLVRTLVNNAFGLYSAFGKLHTFQNSGFYDEPEDALIKYHTLAIPNNFNTGETWYQTEVITLNNITSDDKRIYAQCGFYDVNGTFPIGSSPYVKNVTLSLEDYQPILNRAYLFNDEKLQPKESGLNEITGLYYEVPLFYNGTLNSGEDSVFYNIAVNDDRITEGQIFIPPGGDVGFKVFSREVTGISQSRTVVLFQRAFRVDGGKVTYSFIGQHYNVDGFIDTDSNFQGDTTQTIGHIGKDILVVFGESSVQLWFIDPDPQFSRLIGVIQGGGCTKPDSIMEDEDGVIYLSNNTIMRLTKSTDQKGQFRLNEISYKADDVVNDFYNKAGAILIGFGGNVFGNSFTLTNPGSNSGAKATLTPNFDKNTTFSGFRYSFTIPARMNARIGISENLSDFTAFHSLYFDFKSDGTIMDSFGTLSTTTYKAGDRIEIVILSILGVKVIIRGAVNSGHIVAPDGSDLGTENVFPDVTALYPSFQLYATGDSIRNVSYEGGDWSEQISYKNDLKSHYMSIQLKEKGQYWCINETQAIVYYSSEVGKSSGISIYTFQFSIDYAATLNDEVYVVSGNKLYQFDDNQYTDDGNLFEVRVETHFLDFDSGMDMKHIVGADVAIDGSANIEILTDSNTGVVDYSFPIDSVSMPGGTLPVEAVTQSIALNIVNYDNQQFSFHGFNFYFDVMGIV